MSIKFSDLPFLQTLQNGDIIPIVRDNTNYIVNGKSLYNSLTGNFYDSLYTSLTGNFISPAALNTAIAPLLPITIYQNASGSFATYTALNNATSILLPTSVFQNVSATLLTRSDYKASSATLLPTSVYQSGSALLLTKTDYNSTSATLLPITIYQNASGSFATYTSLNAASGLLTLLTTTSNLTSQLVLNTVINSLTGNWNSAYASTTALNLSSAKWNSAYITTSSLNLSSAKWNSAYITTSSLNLSSFNWNNVYTTTKANSGNWQIKDRLIAGSSSVTLNAADGILNFVGPGYNPGGYINLGRGSSYTNVAGCIIASSSNSGYYSGAGSLNMSSGSGDYDLGGYIKTCNSGGYINTICQGGSINTCIYGGSINTSICGGCIITSGCCNIVGGSITTNAGICSNAGGSINTAAGTKQADSYLKTIIVSGNDPRGGGDGNYTRSFSNPGTRGATTNLNNTYSQIDGFSIIYQDYGEGDYYWYIISRDSGDGSGYYPDTVPIYSSYPYQYLFNDQTWNAFGDYGQAPQVTSTTFYQPVTSIRPGAGGLINTGGGYANLIFSGLNGGSINTSDGGGSINTSLSGGSICTAGAWTNICKFALGGSINTSADPASINRCGGSIDTSANSGFAGGSICTRAGGSINTSCAGGSINTSGSGGGAGGSINTSGCNGGAGGSINTRSQSSVNAPGSINTSSGTTIGSIGGNINTYGSCGNRGGCINTSGGNTGAGGSINTSNGGGYIDTTGVGTIQLGSTGTRTTLTGSATANRSINLPNNNGTIALTTDLLSVSGTANQITATKSGQNVTFSLPSTAVFPGSVTVQGNLTVSGSATYINANNLIVNDNLIYFAASNPANTLDIGMVGHFTQAPLGYNHSGLVRKSGGSTPGTWTLFSGLTSEPLSASNIDWADNNIVVDSLSANLIGNVTGNLITTPNGTSNDWNNSFVNNIINWSTDAVTPSVNAADNGTRVKTLGAGATVTSSNLYDNNGIYFTINGANVNGYATATGLIPTSHIFNGRMAGGDNTMQWIYPMITTWDVDFQWNSGAPAPNSGFSAYFNLGSSATDYLSGSLLKARTIANVPKKGYSFYLNGNKMVGQVCDGTNLTSTSLSATVLARRINRLAAYFDGSNVNFYFNGTSLGTLAGPGGTEVWDYGSISASLINNGTYVPPYNNENAFLLYKVSHSFKVGN